MNHSYTCHCGKSAKFHVHGDDGCGNVCGIHARKYTEKTDTLKVCDACKKHTRGSQMRFNLLTGTTETYCMECAR